MTSIIARLTFAVMAIVSIAGAQTRRNSSGEEAAVRAARVAQNAAIAKGDIDGAASYWAPDIVVTTGLSRVLRGREEYHAAFAADSVLLYRREPERIYVAQNGTWPLAFETGSWTGRVAAGAPPLIRGRYSAQWQKVEGQWRIRSEVFVALGCSPPACDWPVSYP